ncbi:MAG: hypothetical protein Kow0062_23980 [Acidobacteriota bacterium]
MGFWIFGRRRKTKDTAAGPGRAPESASDERSPAAARRPAFPDDPGDESTAAVPADELPGGAQAESFATGPVGWFSRDEIADLSRLDDSRDLARRVGMMMPGASREEVLFRYHLSRAVFLEEFELPVLPQSASRLMALTRDPKAKIGDYVRVIEPDPSLVRAIVDVANSSFFSALQDVSSVDRAIVRIGLLEVERIALIHTLRTRLFRIAGFEAMLDALVRHNVEAAAAAHALATTCRASAADAFLAGLFHDVGKLVVLTIVGDVQRKLSWSAPEPLVHSAFAAFHVPVGDLACRHWKFPAEICAAVRTHHDAARATETPLGRAVYLGNVIAHELEAEDDGTAERVLADPVAEGLGLDARRLEELLASVRSATEPYALARG